MTLSSLEKGTVTLEILVQDLFDLQSDDLSGRWYKERWVCTWRRPISSFKILAVKWGPWSLIMLSGRPWHHKTPYGKAEAVYGAMGNFLRGDKVNYHYHNHYDHCS